MQLVVSIDGFASGISDVGIFIFHIVGMHEHNIFSSLRAFHNFDSFSYPIGTEDSIRLHLQYYILEFPID